MSFQKDMKRLLSSISLLLQMRQMNVYMPNAAISGWSWVVQRVQADCKSQSLPIASMWTVGSLLDTWLWQQGLIWAFWLQQRQIFSPLGAESIDIPDFLKECAASRANVACERLWDRLIFFFFSIHVYDCPSWAGHTHIRVQGRKVHSEFIQKHIAEKRSYFTSSPHQVWKIK